MCSSVRKIQHGIRSEDLEFVILMHFALIISGYIIFNFQILSTGMALFCSDNDSHESFSKLFDSNG